MKKKKNKWIRAQHKFMRNLIYMLVYPFTKLKYHIKIKKQKNVEQCLILSNHQTAFDQFFISFAFKQHVYYVASEDLFSMGWVSRFIKWAVAPIPIKKQTTDLKAVKDCLRVAKEGGTIAIFPEGNRTFSGKTETIKKSIVKLIKALKLPIAFFKIEGGYGVQPRWSDKTRKGKMTAQVSKTIKPEEYLNLTDDQLYDLVKSELYVNEANSNNEFKSKHLAEYLERLVYVCPKCGIAEFESNKNIITCKKCGCTVEYLSTTQLKGINNDFVFSYVNDWYDYQEQYVHNLDLSQFNDKPCFTDTVALSEVALYKNKTLINENTTLMCYSDRFVVNDKVLNFSDITVTSVLGRNKLNIYYLDQVLQIKGETRFNAVKYVNIFYHWKNLQQGNDIDGEFLGL